MKYQVNRLTQMFLSTLIASIFILNAGIAYGRVKEVKKPDQSYNFKAVEKIVVLPVTSENVDYGKVAPKRMPKIRAILEKSKKHLRNSLVDGAEIAKSSIPFYYKAPNKNTTTLLIKYNFDQFDNGNAAARLLPMAGKAKVTIRAQLLDAKNKTVLAEVTAQAKKKGGLVGGGLDSEVLWYATGEANSDIFKYIKKLTGLKYSLVAAALSGKGMKESAKGVVGVMKEEKSELGGKK